MFFFSYARKEPWKIVIRRDSKTGAITIMGRMMRVLFAVLALLTTAVSIAQAGERDLPVKCLTPDGVEGSCAARQHLPPNKQNALPGTARPFALPPPEYDKYLRRFHRFMISAVIPSCCPTIVSTRSDTTRLIFFDMNSRIAMAGSKSPRHTDVSAVHRKARRTISVQAQLEMKMD